MLNSGAILTGIATLIAATAFPSALRRHHTHPVLAWLTTIALLSMGAGAIWAGTFHLPDPRHNPGALGAGAFALPLLFALCVVKRPRAAALKAYLFANLALFLLMIPIMAGLTGLPIHDYRGLLQRIAAAVLYVPVGVVAASMLEASSPA